MTQRTIEESLMMSDCSVIAGAALCWETVNSSVTSLPALTERLIASVCTPGNLTTSIVRVSGPSDEPLHYHTSYVIGVVVHGEGVLHHRAPDGIQVDDVARKGDVVVIPRSAAHVFSTAEGGSMDYIALEFSDQPIDYQAHLPAD